MFVVESSVCRSVCKTPFKPSHYESGAHINSIKSISSLCRPRGKTILEEIQNLSTIDSGNHCFLLLNTLYLICLYEHYAKKALLENLKDFSNTIYYSLYAHLFLGMTSICVILFDLNAYSEFANRVVDALPKNVEMRPQFDRMELFVYHRTFVNLIVFIGLLAYDLTIIDLKSLTRSRAMLFIALYYPHCAIASCLRYFTIQMALLKNICQNLNKRLSDIELTHEFRHHGLYFEYLKSESTTADNDSQCAWNSSVSISTIGAKYEELKIQDSIFFQKWWSTVRNRKHSPRKTDVIEMLNVVQSNEQLFSKLKSIFGDYDHFMKLCRKLEALIQKQLFLIVCQHSIVVLVAIHLLTEIYLEWGDVLDEKNIKLARINYTVHLIHILHDFGCLTLSAIMCRNEIRNTKTVTTKLMAMPFCDSIRCVVSYFYFKLQSFRETVYAFNLIKMDGCSFFMVILQYAVLSVIYALYQYFDIKLENLKSTVDIMNEDDE